MISIDEFRSNLAAVRERIASACAAAGRPVDAVGLLPVTKNHPAEAARHVAAFGLPAVGENRVQEAMAKREACGVPLRWELIGHLQSNKAKDAVATFDRIQSVDSLKLLRRLDRCAGEAGKALPILLQCNSGGDPAKYGFGVVEMEGALEAALSLEHLRVEGLMTVAPLDEDPAVARRAFERLRELRDGLADRFGVALAELSMGMTGDLESAIEAGSTQIRVGTALFGSRGGS